MRVLWLIFRRGNSENLFIAHFRGERWEKVKE
jgi:hypothetical protein